MFVPICRNSHWTLLVADRRNNLISLYDSSRTIPARDLDIAEVRFRNRKMTKIYVGSNDSDNVISEIQGFSILC
jgi:Ulp1 family protease